MILILFIRFLPTIFAIKYNAMIYAKHHKVSNDLKKNTLSENVFPLNIPAMYTATKSM